MKRFTTTLFLSALFFLCTYSITTYSDYIPGGYYYRIRNANSNLYLDCSSTTTGANMRQLYYPSHSSPNTFLFLSNSDGFTYTISPSNAEQLVLNVANGSANDANVNLYTRNATKAQKWRLSANTDGSFWISSSCSYDNKYLSVENGSTASGANVFQESRSKTGRDSWFLEAQVEEGTYLIRNRQTGKYLTVDQYQYVYQDIYNQTIQQRFKIKPTSNGYYDIIPEYNTDWSLSVEGWSLGMDKEDANIYATYGQSDAGQRWRFLVNHNHSFRIVSELSGCKKAITTSDTSKNLFSKTYTRFLNADWELIRVHPVLTDDTYQKERRHIIFDLPSVKYLYDNITPEQLTLLISRLDQAYDLFYDLVGKAPANGNKIRFVEIVTSDKIVLYGYPNGDKIEWKSIHIAPNLKTISSRDDWAFLLLHELGHNFDLECRWSFDQEFFANFKMAYVLNRLDGTFRIFPGERQTTQSKDLISFYKTWAENSFENVLGANPIPIKTKDNGIIYNDSLTYMMLDLIQKNDSWINVKETFREFNNMTSSEIPNTNLQKYNKFLSVLDKKSGNKFLSQYTTTYGRQHTFLQEYYKNN